MKPPPPDPDEGKQTIWETSTSCDIFPLENYHVAMQRAAARIPTGPGFRRKRTALPAKPVERRETERPSFGAQQRLPNKPTPSAPTPSRPSGSAGGNQDTPAAPERPAGHAQRHRQVVPDDCQPEERACKGNVFMQVQQRPASTTTNPSPMKPKHHKPEHARTPVIESPQDQRFKDSPQQAALVAKMSAALERRKQKTSWLSDAVRAELYDRYTRMLADSESYKLDDFIRWVTQDGRYLGAAGNFVSFAADYLLANEEDARALWAEATPPS
jgi:hypothetical protein